MPVPAARARGASTGGCSSSRSSPTADAAFAIDAAKDEVFVRALRRLSGLDYEEFEDLLDTVGRVADEWDDALKREFGGLTSAACTCPRRTPKSRAYRRFAAARCVVTPPVRCYAWSRWPCSRAAKERPAARDRTRR